MINTHTIPKELIAPFLPVNPIILEAGAHIGRDTIKMIKQWPNATIYAFEPVPELFAQLQERTKDYPTIHCFNVALNNQSGPSTFYQSSGRSTATSSLLAPKEYQQEHPETYFDQITVQCVTLDEWAHLQNIFKIDFMWLDMQGGELNALQGGVNILKTVTAIYTEVALTERYASNPLYDEMKAFLEAQGFIVQQEALGKGTWGNVLFIRK